MNVSLPIEWQIIFLGVVFLSAYFSFKTGYESGSRDGVDAILGSLEAQGIIKIEESEE
jgi:hypothetical protein